MTTPSELRALVAHSQTRMTKLDVQRCRSVVRDIFDLVEMKLDEGGTEAARRAIAQMHAVFDELLLQAEIAAPEVP